MGTFSTEIEIGNPDGTRYEPITALVDTGASFTAVPGSLLRKLAVTPHDRVGFILADGSRIERDIGRTWVRINGKTELSLVIFADNEAEALLGAHTLQAMLLAVDTPNEQLIFVDGLLK
jgi:predicted aspartyl protease